MDKVSRLRGLLSSLFGFFFCSFHVVANNSLLNLLSPYEVWMIEEVVAVEASHLVVSF